MDREKLIYDAGEYTYSLKNFQTMKTFSRDIYEGKIAIKEANEYQTDLLAEIIKLRNIQNQEVKKKIRNECCS